MFLGITFAFAGVQKLFDPGFLHAGSADFVGTQLHGFAQGSPLAPLLDAMAEVPVASGLAVALTEIGVGLGTLLGVAELTSAVVGLGISIALWLSATWHVHPYFLGSDSVYALAWLVLIVGLFETERARTGVVVTPADRLEEVGRREFLRGGLLAGATLVVAALARSFAPPAGTGSLASTGADGGSGGTAAPPRDTPAAGGAASGGASGAAGSGGGAGAGGAVIGNLADLPVGQAVGFTAPGVGSAALVRLANDRVVAYSRTCTHAGCPVGYDPSRELLVCPCHGATFDPAQGGAAVAGPTSTPLRSIPVSVDPATGNVVLG
jgi:thiosulfate dehydrogenase (quinone) large subunit